MNENGLSESHQDDEDRSEFWATMRERHDLIYVKYRNGSECVIYAPQNKVRRSQRNRRRVHCTICNK